MDTVIAIVIAVSFCGFLAYQIFMPVKRKVKNKHKSRLYNASVTEKGIPANEVFEMLEDSEIKPNYLGYNSCKK